MKPKRSLLEKTILWSSVFFALCIVITCNLSNHVDAFKCDIVHGSDNLPGWSNTKEEAIKRKTYVCDVVLTYNGFDKDTTQGLKPLKGWVESSWRRGFWYLTTKKDTGRDISYRIVIANKDDRRQWVIINDRQNGYGYETLRYDDIDSLFQGFVDKSPFPDTLYYNVLKKDTLDFKPENIEGRVRLTTIKSK